MESLKSYYYKAIAFCKKQIDKDPCLAKSVLIHISVVVLLCLLSFISALKFNSSSNLEVQIKGKSNQPKVIQATSITSQDLNKQIRSYEYNREQEKKARQDVKDARQDVKEAREKAIKRAEELAKAKAEAARKAKLEDQRKAKLEAKRKEQQKQQELEKQRKLAEKQEQQKQQKLEEQRKIDLQKKKEAEIKKAKLEAEKKRKQQEAEKQRKAREARLAKARAEAQESARRQVQKSQTDSAIASYLGEYQQRIEDHWVRDYCRGIYKFPKAVARNGKFIRLTGTTGDFRCDQSLIDAIKDSTPPVITNALAKQRLQDENISFLFDPYK